MVLWLVGTALAADPSAVCAGQALCKVIEVLDAGAAGQVVHAALHDGPDGAENEPPRFGTESSCAAHGYFLLAPDHAVTPLLRLCNDGYGAAGMGEDSVTVDGGQLTHGQHGGSAWRWSSTRTLTLAPVALTQEASEGMWTLGPNSSESTWSWTSFSGTERWYAPTCDDRRDDVYEAPDPMPFAFVKLPEVTLPDAFVGGGWKTTPLGGCAARATADGLQGFVTHGEPAEPGDSALSAVLTPEHVLFVEVTDDTPVTGAKSWLYDDHLELWQGARRSEYDHCLEPDPTLRQWGIRLADGAVFAGHGAPAPLPVEVATDGGTTRLKIALPGPPEGITVVFSDSDDGRTQERLIATSQLTFGDAATLGRAQPVPPTAAVCDVADGALAPRITRAWPADGSFLCCGE